jgi:hypothetical protein
MDLELKIAHSAKEIGKDIWNQLSGERPFSSYTWYAFGEKVLQDFPPTYIFLMHAGQPVARATFWLKRREWLPINSKALRFGAEKLLQRWPLFACETPLACVSGLILPESSDRALALEKISRTARELAVQSGAAYALFGYIDRQDAVQTTWPETYSPVSYSDAETSLDVLWPDFESYIKHLAKSTRRNIRLHNKEADKLAIAIQIQPSVTAIDEAMTLIQNVETHHQVGHRPWARAMLQNASMVDSRWISARIGDRLVGCCSLYSDGYAQTATLLGLDYSYPQSIYVYYQLIYAAIRCAVENGCKKLYGGGGAYELKRRLGFQKLPDDYLMAAATGRLFRWLLHGTLGWMNAPASNHAGQDDLESGLTTGKN